VLDRMQAAIDAAHAQAPGHLDAEPMTEPLPRILAASAQAAQQRRRQADLYNADLEPPTEPLPRLTVSGAVYTDETSRADNGISVRPDPAPEPDPAPAVVERPDPPVEPDPVARPDPAPALWPDPVVQPDPVVRPDPVPEPVAVVRPDPVLKPDHAVRSQTLAAPELTVRPETVVVLEPVREPDLAMQPEWVADPDLVSEPDADAAAWSPADWRAQQRAGERPQPRRRRRRTAGLVVSVLLLATAGVAGIALTLHTVPTKVRDSDRVNVQLAARSLAASWVARQVSRDAMVACDRAMCSALVTRGFPAGTLSVLGPKSSYPVDSAVVIVTAAVRNLFGSNLSATYAPEIMASFGSGRTRIDVRVISRRGPAAYRAALSRDLGLRKIGGAGLLGSRQIVLSATASRQLLAGQVDSRLLIVVTALAAQHPISIVRFAGLAPGASAGVPLRFADLAQVDAASGLGHAAYLQSMLALLNVQPAPYRPLRTIMVRLASGQAVIQIQFAAPSPLGLLNPQSP
jgi:hypothetical protein